MLATAVSAGVVTAAVDTKQRSSTGHKQTDTPEHLSLITPCSKFLPLSLRSFVFSRYFLESLFTKSSRVV